MFVTVPSLRGLGEVGRCYGFCFVGFFVVGLGWVFVRWGACAFGSWFVGGLSVESGLLPLSFVTVGWLVLALRVEFSWIGRWIFWCYSWGLVFGDGMCVVHPAWLLYHCCWREAGVVTGERLYGHGACLMRRRGPAMGLNLESPNSDHRRASLRLRRQETVLIKITQSQRAID